MTVSQPSQGQPSKGPDPYRVAYWGQVRDTVKVLVDRADRLGIGSEARTALREIDYRLRIYPQFGEQLRDLLTPGHSQWHAIYWDLHVEYVIDELHRLVFVVIPPRPLPRSPLYVPDAPAP